MELDPIDFFPGYDPACFVCARRRRRQSNWLTIFIRAFSISLIFALCGVVYYMYCQSNYLGNEFMPNDIKQVKEPDADLLNELTHKMHRLQKELDKTNTWRKHLDELFTSIYLQQDKVFNNKIEEAISVYDADRIGLYDYASVYAYGSIISLPDTVPYPANKTITFFKLLNMDLLSDPDSLLQPDNLPGNCFAFHGSHGRVRIKLGKKIRIHAVTVDHIKLMDDMSSAPKDFEIFGLHDPDDEFGVSLGHFTYDIRGKAYQTFKTNTNLTFFPFEYVELKILNNYGKKEFTCVYRFRVHDQFKRKLKFFNKSQ